MRAGAQAAFINEDNGPGRTTGFFKGGPAVALPAPDLRLVPFEGPPGGLLATEAQTVQQMPDMAGMILHPALVLDQPGDAGQRSDFRGMAGGPGPVEHRLGNRVRLRRRDPALRAGGSFARQARLAVLLPLPPPDGGQSRCWTVPLGTASPL